MPYCSLTELLIAEPESALIQLTDDAGSGAIVDTVLNAAITEADNVIDAILLGRVEMPTPVPKIIAHLSVELTITGLYRRRFDNNMPETINARRKEAMNLLDRIAKGEIRISVLQSDNKRAASSQVRTPDRVFTQELLDQY